MTVRPVGLGYHLRERKLRIATVDKFFPTTPSQNSLTPSELERRRLGAQRLKERFSSIPFYAKAAERDGPGYWEKFYASGVNR